MSVAVNAITRAEATLRVLLFHLICFVQDILPHLCTFKMPLCRTFKMYIVQCNMAF
jgi:hypothetical protein